MDPKILISAGNDPWLVLALFGGRITTDHASDLYSKSWRLLESCGVAPNVAAFHRKRFGRYRRISASMNPNRGGFRGFALGCCTEDSTNFLVDGIAGIDTSENGVVIAGRDQYFRPRQFSNLSVIKEVAAVYPILYGYQYMIDRSLIPTAHAIGLSIYSLTGHDLAHLSKVEEARTVRWGEAYKAQVERGVIRDVFPVNFLSKVHSELKVSGVPFFNWIEAREDRGELQLISPSLWMWRVPENRCVELGNVLDRAGLLA